MSLTNPLLLYLFSFSLILNKSILSVCIQYRDRIECTVFPFLLSNRIYQSTGTKIVSN
jgi:hypothetical protein